MEPQSEKPARSGQSNILWGLGLLLVGGAVIGVIAYMMWDTITAHVGKFTIGAIVLFLFGNIIWEKISMRKER